MTPAAEQLFESHKRLVYTIAHRHTFRSPMVEFDDLVQVCLIALWRAAASFRPESGRKFTNHAWTAMEHAIIDYMRKINHHRSGRTQNTTYKAFLSLDTILDSDEGDWEPAAPDSAPSPGAGIMEWAAAQALTTRERYILRRYFAEGAILKVCAEELGISEARVSQHKKTLLARLRREAIRASNQRRCLPGEW